LATEFAFLVASSVQAADSLRAQSISVSRESGESCNLHRSSAARDRGYSSKIDKRID
jgi:hypothetical protein